MKKRFFFPIFWKFAIAIVAIVAIFGSINIYLIWSKVYQALETESQNRGHFISHSIAEQAVNPMLYADYITLQRLLNTARKIDSTVVYAFILDEHNNVLVHTFESGIPSKLITANLPGPNQPESVRLIQSEANPTILIQDTAVPILQGKLGTVRIGILERNIGKNVRNTTFIFVGMVVVFLTLGIIGALVFAKFIKNPVREISAASEELDFDRLQFHNLPRIRIREKLFGIWKAPIRAEDELDLLAEKFNGMIDRLENAYAELQTAHNSMIQSEKLAAVGTLSAGIAHEINNPLAGLQSCIRRLRQNPGNIQQNRFYLKMMEEAAGKIERVVKGLLDFTRQEEIKLKNIKVAETIEKALLLAAYNLEKARISVTKELAPNLPEISGSSNHLQQVFVNLLLNSIHAIRKKREDNPDTRQRIIISSRVENQWLKISVEDSGIGIPDGIKEKIFDPFFTTKPAGEGTGLGLSVCYNIIKAHGGKIETGDSPLGGARFTIVLPIQPKKGDN